MNCIVLFFGFRKFWCIVYSLIPSAFFCVWWWWWIFYSAFLVAFGGQFYLRQSIPPLLEVEYSLLACFLRIIFFHFTFKKRSRFCFFIVCFTKVGGLRNAHNYWFSITSHYKARTGSEYFYIFKSTGVLDDKWELMRDHHENLHSSLMA